jgi:hypothetical protein
MHDLTAWVTHDAGFAFRTMAVSGHARAGVAHARTDVETPTFMPSAPKGA